MMISMTMTTIGTNDDGDVLTDDMTMTFSRDNQLTITVAVFRSGPNAARAAALAEKRAGQNAAGGLPTGSVERCFDGGFGFEALCQGWKRKPSRPQRPVNHLPHRVKDCTWPWRGFVVTAARRAEG